MSDMSSMDMSSNSSSMTMTMMSAVFTTVRSTSLYSAAWTPMSTGAYAGTCLFLIALGAVFRALLAGKAWQEARWLDAEMHRRYVIVQGKASLADRLSQDSDAKEFTLATSEQGVEERVMVVQKRHVPRPWRLSVDPLRAAIDVVIAGVGYLLMLAVMTMNVGYFLSVLAGTFIGSLIVGRFITSGEH